MNDQTMNFDDCIKFATENPTCYFATIEGDQPRVRALGMWRADRTGFYFGTTDKKEIPKQLKVNPKIECCFFNNKGSGEMKMLRIAGSVEFVNDAKMKKQLVKDWPFLKSMGFNAESPGLFILRLGKGEAYFWTMQTNLKPKEKIRFG